MAVQLTKTQNLPSLPMQRLKDALNTESVMEQFRNALQENAGAFVASIIDLYGSDTYLQQCNPNAVIMEALKAATLKLPINKQLGFAFIVPYKKNGVLIPQFQLGYKGYIQLAMRTGQYKHLNAGIIYEGMKIIDHVLSGEAEITGEPTSDKPQEYFAYMELLNGFTKTLHMTRNKIICHAKKYSKSYNSKFSAWETNFDEMAIKTVIRLLLSKYGMLSTEMVNALTQDTDEDMEAQVANEVEAEANQEVIDIEPEEVEEKSKTEPQQPNLKGPGF
jgi:recombination protein RecT